MPYCIWYYSSTSIWCMLLKQEQLECLRSEDTLCHLIITHTIESYWICFMSTTLFAILVKRLYDIIKTPSFQYRNSHYKDDTVWRPSHFYNGNPYKRKDWGWNDTLKAWHDTIHYRHDTVMIRYINLVARSYETQKKVPNTILFAHRMQSQINCVNFQWLSPQN